MRLTPTLLTVLSCIVAVHANTEKTIFLGPPKLQIPNLRPDFYDLNLESLSPSNPSLRKHVEVAFPTASEPKGIQSWYLLDDLEPGRRYELRVCWAAVQPTQFWLYSYPVSEVFDIPALISALALHSESRQNTEDLVQFLSETSHDRKASRSEEKSLLFLQVYAAADFYTTNRTLMNDPPPVYVDLILDPYFLNVLPRSLLPTVVYVIVVALGSWYLSGYVWTWLLSQASDQEFKSHAE